MAIRLNYRPLFAVLGVGVLSLLLFLQHRASREWKHDEHSAITNGGLTEPEYRRGIQYEGSGERVQRFLGKLSRGEAVTVSVIGGSGRGLTPASIAHSELTQRATPTLYSPENMHVLVFDWLSNMFPGDHRFINGAQGAVGAEYFGWCFKEHISDDADLVIIELGINDLVSTTIYAAYERLIRSVLEMKNKPAVINIETFTVLFSPILSASAAHQDICAYYDIPSISLRDVILPRILADPEEEIPRWFRTGEELSLVDPKVKEYGGEAVDMMHISALGHALAADLIVRYLSHQLHQIRRRGWWRGIKEGEEPGVPSTLLTGSFEPYKKIPISTPVCRSMNSEHTHGDVSQDDEGSEEVEGVKGIVLAPGSEGWTVWAWKEKRFLISKTPGSIAKFNFITTRPSFPPPPRLPNQRPIRPIDRPNRSKNKMRKHEHQKRVEDVVTHRGGSIAIAYQRSKFFGLGMIKCWVDENMSEAMTVDGYWEIQERNMGVVMEIANQLPPGPHTLSCELLPQTNDPKGRTEFRIIAVVHD